MDKCLAWTVNAGYAKVSRYEGSPDDKWQVVSGAWNEQHCYPIATDFFEVPGRSWYMGDIPHGWACAEFMLLLRDIFFFEADEDGAPHIYIAPGVLPHWVGDGESVSVSDAPTFFSTPFGFPLTHDQSSKTIELTIPQAPPAHVGFVYSCRFGSAVSSIIVDGNSVPVTGIEARLPGGTMHATIKYL